MRKVFALVIGLLMLGGMMGMVSAAEAPWLGLYYDGNGYGHVWHSLNYNVGSGEFKISWEAYINDTKDYFNVTIVQVNVSDAYNQKHTAFIKFISNSTGYHIVYGIDNRVSISTSLGDQVVNNWKNYSIIVYYSDLDGASRADMYIGTDRIGSGTIMPGTGTVTGVGASIDDVQSMGSVSKKDPLFIDNIFEWQGTYRSGPYTFDSGKLEYFDEKYSRNYEITNAVPFFSNAGIAAVTLLLVLGAVWFFRRQ